MTQFISDGQQQLITRFRQVYSTYQENRDLIAVGAHQAGSNPQLDEAITLWPAMTDFLRQPMNDSVNLAEGLDDLRALFEPRESTPTDAADDE